VGGHVYFLALALAVWKFGWGFPGVILVSLSLVGFGILYFGPTCVSLSFIDVGDVQPPAHFSFLCLKQTHGAMIEGPLQLSSCPTSAPATKPSRAAGTPPGSPSGGPAASLEPHSWPSLDWVPVSGVPAVP